MHSQKRRRLLGSVLGLVAGTLVGVGLLSAVSGAGVAGRSSLSAARAEPPLAATHVSPALTAAGETVDLRYDIYCTGSDDPTVPCDAGGTVYYRTGSSGSFRTLPLQLDETATTGRYFATLPVSPNSGYSYYAVLRDNSSGATLTLPAGGAVAPDRILPLGDGVVSVDLGTHVFGATQSADARVAAASWGDGKSQVGLEDNGPDATPVGAAAFDVDSAGGVTVLDEAHRRVLRWGAGVQKPKPTVLDINGTIADMSLAPDGSIYVLESTAEADPTPLLRTFDATGNETSETAIAERTAPEVRVAPDGPAVLEYPSGQWMSMATNGVQLDESAQTASATAGSRAPDGTQVVVLREDNELRVATVSSDKVKRSWRITSSTPMGEVQLAQPLGKKLVAVVRLYNDTQAEFAVLVVGGDGIVKQFSLDSADWAETAPLTRFRLVGSSLYQLGSTSAGIFVDRFDLGVS